MRVWRLAKASYAELDGEGARLYGGRWNSAGSALVYTASSLSLALLEQLVRIDPDEIPDDFVSIAIDLPRDFSVQMMTQDQFPAQWQKPEYLSWFRQQGDTWLKQQTSLALIVPSVIVSEETNILLNPQHPEMKKVKLAEIKPFIFDNRLF